MSEASAIGDGPCLPRVVRWRVVCRTSGEVYLCHSRLLSGVHSERATTV